MNTTTSARQVALRSLSTHSTIAAETFTQMRGTAVQLANAKRLSANYFVPTMAVNEEALILRLTIIQSNGETNS
jgi:hypothetical protein